MLKFTEEHEWLKLDGDVATVGITEHATTQLGDLVFVQLPDIGAKLGKGDGAAVVESVKAASDVFAPLAGERRRRRELHVAANLLEQRPQIRIRADPLQLGDLRADGLEALREPLDALGTGQCPDQPADLLEFAEETGQRVVVPAGGSGRRHAARMGRRRAGRKGVA